VADVPNLHIWGMSTTDVALTAHLVKPDAEDEDQLIAQACKELHDRFGIEHATLQIERAQRAHPCSLAPAQVI
jgi:cobalt-zinc-cadmium efflux system protein